MPSVSPLSTGLFETHVQRARAYLAEGKADRMVAWWNRQVIDVPLEKVVGRSRTVDRDGALIRTARALGICLGDAA